MSIALLVLALTLFFLSTRQWPLWFRIVACLAGAVALIAVPLLSDDELSAVLSGVVFNKEGESSIGLILQANWITVEQALLPLSVVLFAGSILIGILAVMALTPGEKTERIARQLIALTVGFTVGGAFALLSVSLGFAGYMKPRMYIFMGDRAEVVDGDTLKIGDVSLRLDGIDALEHDQSCLSDAVRTDCGAEASRRLRELVSGHVVLCARRNNSTIPPREAFSRPIVLCSAGSEADIGRAMMRSGLAVPYVRPRGAARFIVLGERCTPHPSTWRGRGEARTTFEAEGASSHLCS